MAGRMGDLQRFRNRQAAKRAKFAILLFFC
jgi:hypothetical protein